MANNYNFINNKGFETVGKCLYPTGQRGELCNTTASGCSVPYVCLQDGNKNVCLENLDPQECFFDDQCPDGFVCNSDKECIPKTGSICLKDGCDNRVYLWKYTPGTESKYTRIIQIPFGVNSDNFNLYMGQSYVDNQISRLAVYNKINQTVVIVDWNSTSEEYQITGRYTLTLDSEMTFEALNIDPDNNILLFYKKTIKSYTRRSYKITGGGFEVFNINTSFCNIEPGTSLIYYINNGKTSGLGPQKYEIFTFDVQTDDFINIRDSSGGLVNFHDDIGNYFVTYDNTVCFNNGTVSWDAGIGYCEGLFGSSGTSYRYSWVNTGDKFYNEGSTDVKGLTEGLSYTETLDTNNISPYFFSQSSSYDYNYSYYMVADNFNSSDGSAPFINGKKFISQEFTYNNSKAKLYSDLVTYGVAIVDLSSSVNGIITINIDDLYVQEDDTAQYQINGLPVNGVTYAFEDDMPIKFSSYEKDNQKSLLIDTQIKTEAGTDVDKQFTKNINYVQKINYNLSDYDGAHDHQFKPKNGTSWFNFTYINNTVAPTGKNLFQEILTDTNINFNDAQSNYQNNFVIENNQDLNIFTSYYNNQNNIQGFQDNEVINIATQSQFKKLETDYSTSQNPPYDDKVTFKNKEDIFSVAPQALDGSLVQINKATAGQNTFLEGENIITINNQKDIDTILKFSSSEISIVKETGICASINEAIYNKVDDLVEAITPGTSFYGGSADYTRSWMTTAEGTTTDRVYYQAKGNPQVIIVITDIIEHEINLQQEYLLCRINRPINYNTNIGTCAYQFESLIIDDQTTDWNFYLYNYVPLTYKNIFSEPIANGNYYLHSYMATNIFDGSIIYTSTKNHDFFKTNTDYSKTSYNKIIAGKYGKPYSINTINDGYGFVYNDIIGTETTPPNPIAMQDQNSYKTNYMFANSTQNEYNNPVTGYFKIKPVVPPPIPQDIIGLPINIPLVTNSDNYPAPPGDPNPGNYPKMRFFFHTGGTPDYSSNNYSFFIYPIGRVAQLLTLIPYGEVLGNFNGGEDYFSNFGQGFYTGYTSNEKLSLPVKYTTPMTDHSIPGAAISLSQFYNIFTNHIEHEGRKIFIDDLVAGPIYNTLISLAGSNYIFENSNLVTINNLFMSTLNYVDNLGTGYVINNNERIEQNYTISNIDSKGVYKKKGTLKLNVDSTPFIVKNKNNNKVITTLDSVNVDKINWPSWISSLALANKFPHKILNVIYNPRENNSGSNANYYVYTSYEDEEGTTKYQMYYFNVNKDLTSDAGVVLADPDNAIYKTDNIIMEPLSDSFYMLGETKTP